MENHLTIEEQKHQQKQDKGDEQMSMHHRLKDVNFVNEKRYNLHYDTEYNAYRIYPPIFSSAHDYKGFLFYSDGEKKCEKGWYWTEDFESFHGPFTWTKAAIGDLRRCRRERREYGETSPRYSVYDVYTPSELGVPVTY